MAIQRLTVAQIEAEVLQNFGYTNSNNAPWGSSNNFVLRVNEYMQALPVGATAAARAAKLIEPTSGPLRFDWYKTTGNANTSANNQDFLLPIDFDHWISFYDNTNHRTIHPTENIDKYWVDSMRNSPPGPPKVVELLGWDSGNNARKAKIYPAVTPGVTPSISITYWRIPAAAANTSDKLDIDPRFELLVTAGVTKTLARSPSKEYERFEKLEKELLLEMALTGRTV